MNLKSGMRTPILEVLGLRNRLLRWGVRGDVVSTLGYKHEIVRVPEGHCWVEGDHTGHSMDSNSFGPVALGLMSARAVAIVWPPERWRILENELPRRRRPIQASKNASNYYN